MIAAAAVVATVAFWAYTRTLLPGVDLGDTGGFQAAAVWEQTSAREGYPLYYALGERFIAAAGTANPARGLNLFSAVWAAITIGLLMLVAARITRSALAGAAGALLLAFSYTFWTQAIIAEVYTLHLAFIAACLLALAWFQRQPSIGRLAAFLAVYALSFGNHHAMILLMPPFACFVLLVHPRPRELFRPAVLGMAVGIAAVATLQYSGNFLAVWTSIDAARPIGDRLAGFWFEATKADWRETMVLGANSPRLDRLAMWWWDMRQQFGAAGIAVAVAGAIRLWWIDRAWAALVLSAYAVSAGFALTYNVGDVHVFFLPAHFFTAAAAAAALAPMRRSWVHVGCAVMVLGYAGWRGWDTWPAVDRHADRRGEQLVARTVQGLADTDAILISGLDWEAENALLYASRHGRREVAWMRIADVLPHLPFLVADNHEIGRDIVLTADAAAAVVSTYGPLFPLVPDTSVPALSIADAAASLPAGTPYVLTLLPAATAHPLPAAELGAVLAALGFKPPQPAEGTRYEIWAGVAGRAPTYHRAEHRPFRERFSLLGDPFLIRMESWQPEDTFRRAGFGRVLRGREPVLTVERGLSLAWFRASGSPAVVYGTGLYAAAPRYRIPAQAERFALCSNPCARFLP